MTAYLVMFVLAGPWGDVSQPGPHGLTSAGPHLSTILIAAFLAWRVASGGAISRWLIIIYTIIGAGAVINSGSARSGSLITLGLLAIYALQLAILLSTPIYNRTRQAEDDLRPRGTPFWEVPPRWMLLVALVGGIVITLLFLGNMSFRPVSDCGYLSARAAPSAGCTTLAEGYPVHYLSTSPSVSGSPASISVFAEPVVRKGAAAEDLAVWAAVSFLACYMIWLPSCRRTRSAATDQPVPV